MVAKRQLSDLAARRRLLVLEADLHRNLIAMEGEKLRAQVSGLQIARDRIAAGGPWLVVGGVIAGLLALRHGQELMRWVKSMLGALRWLKVLK